MKNEELRVALFSGNYNYVRDGANQALNLLVGYLLSQGVKVRVYSPTIANPPFEPTGDLVSVPSLPMPGGRSEYHFATGIKKVLPDLEAFNPNLVHVSAPDILGHRAITWARKRNLPSVASLHTRFETYPQYYGIGFLTPLMIRALTRFYNRPDTVLTTGPMMTELLRSWGVTTPVSIWSRGINHKRFNPGMRSLEWRRSLGIADDEVAIGFLGRLVLEKGLGVFADVIKRLEARGVKHRVLVVGEGPARDWFAERVPDAVFTGFQSGQDLGRAVASMDVFFNPSITESFGNVTLEAMASGVAVVAAYATGPVGIIEPGVSGLLCDPNDLDSYADALEKFATDHEYRKATGAAGHRRGLDYQWDKINQAALDAYQDTIARKG